MPRVQFSYLLTIGTDNDEPPSTVTVDESAELLQMVWRLAGETDPEVLDQPRWLIVEPSNERVEIDAAVTVGEFTKFAGTGPHHFTYGGWGGDGLWHEVVATAWELINLGLTLQGAKSLAVEKGQRLNQFRYRRHQQLAAEWRDGDHLDSVPMELRQLVKSSNPWWRTRFDFVFDLGDSAGTALLKGG